MKNNVSIYSNDVLKGYIKYLLEIYSDHNFKFRIYLKDVVKMVDNPDNYIKTANERGDLYNDVLSYIRKGFQKIETNLKLISSNQNILTLEEFYKVKKRKEIIKTIL